MRKITSFITGAAAGAAVGIAAYRRYSRTPWSRAKDKFLDAARHAECDICGQDAEPNPLFAMVDELAGAILGDGVVKPRLADLLKGLPKDVNLHLATQRPDADEIDGTLKDNLGFRANRGGPR